MNYTYIIEIKFQQTGTGKYMSYVEFEKGLFRLSLDLSYHISTLRYPVSHVESKM